MSRGAPMSLGIFGKLPSKGDFVRFGTVEEPFVAFGEWVFQGVEQAAVAPGWRRAFEQGAIHAFAYRHGSALLAGALGPSSDQGGRHFPLVAASSCSATRELTRDPQVLPLVLESLWIQASGLVSSLRGSNSERALELPHAELAIGPLMPSAEALEAYEAWTSELSCSEFWALIYGRQDVAARHALALVADAVRPYRGVEQPDTPLSLRLPLGQAGGAGVCFWIDLVRRLARWRETIPSFFWSHDGESGALLLHLGDPPHTALAELWMPSGDRDEFCDLAALSTPGAPAEFARLAEPLEEVLDGEGSLGDLLRASSMLP